ncbi:MAG TPA: hypothetical protein VG476_07100 [Acidimicrobiales bacterium]|nr:hypothetical protein [Acidimicrobiales bacterium]
MQTTELRPHHNKPMPTLPPQTENGARRRMLDYLAAGPSGSAARRAATTVVLLVGAALVATTGAIHLHLWAAGYRTIPTIGPLFLFQGIAGASIAVAVVVARRLLAVVAAAGFLVATIGGLLLSVYVGLFGFMDTLAAPFAGVSLAVESIGAVVLACGAIMLLMGRRSHP